MGSLTGFLQERFAAACPAGWTCTHEVDVLDAEWQRVLGYSARADVLLTRDDGQKRLWIEFEVSRADPVANHAKFATSHLFQPQAPTDTFVAMVSSHVTRGRRNLAANTILLMRHVGMRAFQTMLLPTISPSDIKRLNHLSIAELLSQSIDTNAEIARAMLEPSIEVLVPPPLPNIIWPRLPPHHPYHLPPGYHWPDNLLPGHPGHDVKPPKPPGGSGDAGSEGSDDEAGSSDSEGC